MAPKLSVTVFDYDVQDNVLLTTNIQNISVEEIIDGSSSATVTLKGLTKSYTRDDLQVIYDGKTLFNGIIQNQSDSLTGGGSLQRHSSWKAKDTGLRLENRLVNKRYEHESVENIILDLLVSYPCGITGNHVRVTNVNIEEITFPYVNLYDCIKQLADIVGWRWYVDADRDLHFFETDEGEGAVAFSTTNVGFTRNILVDSISLNAEVDDLTANRVWIIGALEASPNYVEQTYTGDGSNNLFAIAFTPNDPEITEDGLAKTIEADKGKASNKDYVFDKENQVLRRVAGALPNGIPAVLTYRPTRQVIDYFEDTASMAMYGIYEKAIKDKKIKEKKAARSRGRVELKHRSNEIRTISFETRELNVDRGMRHRIVIPELEIDSYWVCMSVTAIISAPDHVNITKSVEFEEVT